MVAQTINRSGSSRHLFIYLIVSLAGSLFLLFIDEGNYHLRGLTNPGNIIALVIYSIGILMGQLLVENYFFKKFEGVRKILLICSTGFLGGFIIGIFIILFFKYFFISVAYISELLT
jgi:hypothetical protein